MNESNYKTLGLDESSSFEEVQVARKRLLEECESNPQRKEAIEAAYDAILMERLRMRQEGKIKVPDRIRFAEKASESSTSIPRVSLPAPQPPNWLQDWLDTPSRDDILWPSVVFLTLAALAWFAANSAATALGFSVAATIFFLNRKEHKFWRSLAFATGGLLVGVLLGLVAIQLVGQQSLGLPVERLNAVVAIATMLLLWFVSSFLR
ncbi:CPP1-like family protein [Leptolyngbya cf. ectocarpi LEGE 11479]|uniref:CPP1-like family protein n=1 Tax=Leptolyngbya cf. ectocarpi LEGE 11479 TaxID=1828722 RepID=A0A928X0D9_LEPEC|nr:CPP1-like family protein [Leptolyngbya ectocarpi]MBE9066152.1 CPP1-like family protein [Leptolyngbya cf. ectocarpi LEGE 11479]